MNAIHRALVLVLTAGLLVGCYYRPDHRRDKTNPSFVGEAEAEEIIQARFAPHGVKFITNMRLQREGADFTADGYDRDVRVGFEYRSREGGDFEGEPGQSPEGLTAEEITALDERAEKFREFFLIIPEGPRDSFDQPIDDFIKMLYEQEVLKRAKVVKKDNLFPEEAKKHDELLPWEATGDLREKRKQMETKETLRKEMGEPAEGGESADDDAAWQGGEEGDKVAPKDEDADIPGLKPESKPEPKPQPQPKPKPKPKQPKDDVWGEEEDDF